jgi:hypothetical protein
MASFRNLTLISGTQTAFYGIVFSSNVEMHLFLIQIHCSYFIFGVVFAFFRHHCWTKFNRISGQRTCAGGTIYGNNDEAR